METAGASAPQWFAVQAATRGRAHIRSGAPCQDKTCVLRKNGVFAIALADGAGSAAKSDLGAQEVVNCVCELLCERFDEFYNAESPTEARKCVITSSLARLRETASVHRCGLSDLSSTLLTVAVSGERYLLFHLGDGVIGYLKDGEIRVATRPANGEFVNVTYFVTSPNATEKLRARKGRDADIQGFVLMSDGCEPGLYHKGGGYLAPALARLLYRLSVTSEEYMQPNLQKSLDDAISAKTSDDCSLILAARHDSGFDTMTSQEERDFFELDGLSPKAARFRGRRFRDILRTLDAPQSDERIASGFRLTDVSSFARKWLKPLVEMGYVERTGPHEYRRVIQPKSAAERGNG